MECPHMIKSVSTAGVRKKLKTEIKAFCHPCTFKAFGDTNEYWFCLQCGHIGCGDMDAQHGDAVKHYSTPRSDLHSIVVHLEKDSKCWCFECKAEVNSKSAHLKDVITIVKRGVKFRPKVNQTKVEDVDEKSAERCTTVAIPLPPPPQLASLPLPMYSSKKGQSSSGRNNQQNIVTAADDSDYPRPKDKPFGLYNLGNTCFMNSAIQCLASTRLLLPKLEVFGKGQELKMLLTQTENEALVTVLNDKGDGAEAVIGVHLGNGDVANNNVVPDISANDGIGKPLQITLEISPESMTGRLKHTLRAIRKSQSPDSDVVESYSSREFYGWGDHVGFRPRGVHDLIGKNFRPGQQHDSHELLRCLVDMMKKDQTKAFRKGIMKHYGMEIGGEGSDPKLVELVKTLDQKVKHKTFVDDVFGGELMTTQTCLTCKSVKRSHEQFLDLSLPIRVMKHVENSNEKKSKKQFSLFDSEKNIVINRSLEECLRAFTEPELLTGSNVVDCDNCHKLNLAKLEAGVPIEEVFPSVVSKKSVQPPEKSDKGSTGGKRQEDRKKKRPTRQQKLKNAAVRISISEAENPPKLTEDEKDSGESSGIESSSLPLVENHFESSEKDKKVNSEEKKRVGEDSGSNQSGGSLDDYVLIQSNVAKANFSGVTKRKFVEVDDTDSDLLEEVIATNAFEIEQQPLAATKFSESLHNLSLLKLEDGQDISGEDDFDLPPAIDGVGGSASEGEDNEIPPLDLGLPSYDKFESFQITDADDPTAKPATADEGFSEGENSASLENEAAPPQRSESSSRNSISDPDEAAKSSSADEKVAADEAGSIKFPKVTRCPCSRQQTISRPPEFLTVHLKRFQMSFGGSATKVRDHVTFPLTLDLTPFCFPGDKLQEGGSNIFDEDGQVLYSLYGIVEHSGTLNWGHYVAHVKTGEDSWFCISDSTVNKSSVKQVSRVEAYILFYERVRGAEEKRKVIQSAEPEPESTKTGEEDDIWAAWDEDPKPVVTVTWDPIQTELREEWDNISASAQPVYVSTDGNAWAAAEAESKVEWGVPAEPSSTGIDWGANHDRVLEWNEDISGPGIDAEVIPPSIASSVGSFIELGGLEVGFESDAVQLPTRDVVELEESWEPTPDVPFCEKSNVIIQS